MTCSEWDCTRDAYTMNRGHALCEDHYEAEHEAWERVLAGGPVRQTGHGTD